MNSFESNDKTNILNGEKSGEKFNLLNSQSLPSNLCTVKLKVGETNQELKMFPIFDMHAKVPANSDFLQKNDHHRKCTVENKHQKCVDYNIPTVENNSINCKHIADQKVNAFINNSLSVPETWEDSSAKVQKDIVDNDFPHVNTFDVISNEISPSIERHYIEGNCGQVLTNIQIQSNSKRKNRQKKSIHSNLLTMDIQNTEIVEPIGKRSVTGKVFNNSKNIDERAENENFNRQMQNYSNEHLETTLCSKINMKFDVDSKIVVNSSKCAVPKTGKECKNEEENLKLFPIFTSLNSQLDLTESESSMRKENTITHKFLDSEKKQLAIMRGENSHYKQNKIEMESNINFSKSPPPTTIKQSEKLLKKNKYIISTDYNNSYLLKTGMVRENSDVNIDDSSVELFNATDKVCVNRSFDIYNTVNMQNPNVDFTDNDRIVTETVEYLCSRTCQNIVSNTSLHQNENGVCTFSTAIFPTLNNHSTGTKEVSYCASKQSNSTKKNRQKKSIKNKLHSLDIQNTEILLEPSCRRQSLRSRSLKSEVGDSRLSSQSKFIKTQKIETQMINDHLSQITADDNMNINLEVTVLPNISLFENKIENVTETKKLFPIFTSSNSQLDMVENKSSKRKNAVEYKDYEAEYSVFTVEENLLSKKKKTKIESNMDYDEIAVLKSRNTILKYSRENYNYISTINDNSVSGKEVKNKHLKNLDLSIVEDINKLPKSVDSNGHQKSNISIPLNVQKAILHTGDVISTAIETTDYSYSKIGKNVSYDSYLPVINIDDSSDEISFAEKHTMEKEVTCQVLDRASKETNFKRTKGKKSICNKILDEQSTQLIPEISSRRQSLRSSGARDKILNYCENISVNKSVKKQNLKIQVQNTKLSKDIKCNKDPNINLTVLATSMKNKKQRKSKNVKKNGKLFPIFTDQVSQSGTLLKEPAVRKTNVSNDICTDHDVKIVLTIEEKESSKKMKDKIEPGTKCVKGPSILTYQNAPKEISSIPDNIQLVTEVEVITESSENSGIHIIEEHIKPNSICIKNSTEKCTSKTNEKDNKTFSKFKKKVQYEDNNLICFPIFSHLNACSTTFINAPNKYYIKEIFYNDIVVPIGDGAMDLIDCECMQMIKSNESFDLKRHKIIDLSTNIVSEDMMWTEFAQNFMTEKSNFNTVQEIKSWLLQWKNKFSNSRKDSSDSESYSSDTDDNFISNGIIISGAPGSGKTSLVFSLAYELGFTVLEVNASSCRNGRNISHQLKEALDSYHVESITLENSNAATVSSKRNQNKTSKEQDRGDIIYSLKNKNLKDIKLKTCNVDPRDVKNKIKKQGITNFFQSKDKAAIKQYSKHKRTKNIKNINDVQQNGDQGKNNENISTSKKSCKISSLTIILFDDVDIVFDEDEGFWSTVKGFLKITKKPVIFTVSRNLSIVKSILNSDIKIFNMQSASKNVAMMKLKECCKKYLRKETTVDFDLLTSHNIGDLRRSILNAQFWSQNPKYTNKVDEITCNIKNSRYFLKPVYINSFLTGDLNFSVGLIRKLLFEDLPNNLFNVISQYQSLGYDILYNNMYHILYNLRSAGNAKLWPSIIKEFQKFGCSAKSFSDTEMWKEACELFEYKKKALKNGSCSQELNLCADAFDDFSYADMLKGSSYNKFQCISMSERVKFWSSGLPICSEQNMHEVILDIISLVHIYRMRKLQSATCVNYSVATDSSNLELEHPLYQLNQTFSNQVEEDLKCISSCLPSSYLLNKRALNLDYLSTIKIMCQDEESRQHQSGKRSGRFLHYFDSISLLIDKKTF